MSYNFIHYFTETGRLFGVQTQTANYVLGTPHRRYEAVRFHWLCPIGMDNDEHTRLFADLVAICGPAKAGALVAMIIFREYSIYPKFKKFGLQVIEIHYFLLITYLVPNLDSFLSVTVQAHAGQPAHIYIFIHNPDGAQSQLES